MKNGGSFHGYVSHNQMVVLGGSRPDPNNPLEAPDSQTSYHLPLGKSKPPQFKRPRSPEQIRTPQKAWELKGGSIYSTHTYVCIYIYMFMIVHVYW